MAVSVELRSWLDGYEGGLANHEIFLVHNQIWARMHDEGRPDGEIAVVLRILAPLEFHAHGKEPEVWNSIFSPKTKADAATGTLEYPELVKLGADDVADWIDLGSSLKRPELRARFSDAAWELSPRIGGQRPRGIHMAAKRAISAYMEAASLSSASEPFVSVQAAARAIQLAAQLGSAADVVAGFQFFSDFAARAKPEEMACWFAPFDRLMHQRGITSAQRAAIVSALEARFWETVRRDDLHRQKMTGQALAKYFHARREYSKAREITYGYGEAIVKLLERERAGFAAHHLTSVSEDYARMGMREDVDRVRVLVEQRGREAAAEMREHFVEFSFQRDELERDIEAKLDHEDPVHALWHLAWTCMPMMADVIERCAATASETSYRRLIPISIMDEGGLPVASVGTSDVDEEGHHIMEYSRDLQLSATFFVLGLDRWMAKYGRQNFAGLPELFAGDLIPESRREIVASGFEAYVQGDFVKAVHVLIPQVENGLRRLLANLGLPVTKTDADGNFEQKNVNDVLHDDAVQARVPDRFRTYLKVLYTEKRGLNLRNLVMHGIAEPAVFHQHTAAMVLQSVVLMRTLGEPGVLTPMESGTNAEPVAVGKH